MVMRVNFNSKKFYYERKVYQTARGPRRVTARCIQASLQEKLASRLEKVACCLAFERFGCGYKKRSPSALYDLSSLCCCIYKKRERQRAGWGCQPQNIPSILYNYKPNVAVKRLVCSYIASREYSVEFVEEHYPILPISPRSLLSSVVCFIAPIKGSSPGKAMT